MPNAPAQVGLSRAIALFRLGLGAWLVWLALPNLDRSFIDHMPGLVETFSAGNPYGVAQWLLNQIILPNAESVGALFPVAQLLVGAALILGVVTQFTALLGLAYAASLLLMSGHLGVTYQGFAIVLGLGFATLALADAGRFYGLDGFLFKPPSLKDQAKSAKKKEKSTKYKNKKQKEVVEALNKKLKTKSKPKKKPKPQPAARRFDFDDDDED